MVAAKAAEAKDTAQADKALDTLLTQQLEARLNRSPETLTSLGLDRAERAPMRFLLDDNSFDAEMKFKGQAAQNLADLSKVKREALSSEAQTSLDIARFNAKLTVDGAREFSFGNVGGRPAPYAVSQISGAYYQIPDWLDTSHRIETKDDAEAFVARVEAFSGVIDNQTKKVERDGAQGVILPQVLMAKTLEQLRTLKDTAYDKSIIGRALEKKLKAAKLEGDYAARTEALIAQKVNPALNRQIEALSRLQPKSTDQVGVWRFSKGEAYYNYGILANTTANLSGAEVHRIGLEQVKDLQSKLDALLKQQGLSQGSVSERLDALNRDPKHLYLNTDEGRATLLRDLNAYVAEVEKTLPRAFNRLPKAKLDIRRVPPAIETGAPGGYYQGASLDGARPGAYYINLKDTADWPRWALKTLTYHEGVPGHHFQISISREAGELPLYRRLGGFAGYNEGWALYAEQLADELGLYEQDPLGKIGFLQSYLFRAVRLVVDSGLHHARWDRETAIRWMIDNAGSPRGKAEREIDRYCAWPGQACAYKIGHTRIAGLRALAQSKKGQGFDLKAFHDVVLLSGSVPLEVLERRVQAWLG